VDGYVILLTVCGFLVVYCYALYPLLLWCGARLIRRADPPRMEQPFPSVSIVVAAHNEEPVIAEKIRNTLALEYPRHRLEFLIGSDGSTDRTDEICRAHEEVTFERIEPRQGKANVLNTLIPKARGEIIVLSDANTIIEPGALAAMVRHFDDPTVGGVCGRLVLVSERQELEDTERIYWCYETKIKELESRCYSTVGANGGIYAIRKELFARIPSDTIIDDFIISMNLLEQRRRMVFEPTAIAREEVSKSFRDLFWTKVRIGAGNLQALRRRTTFLLKVPAFAAFAYVSHKALRWLSPLLLIACWFCSLALADRPAFGFAFWLLNLSMALAVAGVLRVTTNKLVMALAYAYSLNLALLVGYGGYILGLQPVTWRRAER
jgi:poly-beta-1,6-N-acetyl-D-glucosamine synthase